MYAARVRRRPHYRMSMDFRLSDKVTGDPTRHVVIPPTPFITNCFTCQRWDGVPVVEPFFSANPGHAVVLYGLKQASVHHLNS
jgi:hypothetical protein